MMNKIVNRQIEKQIRKIRMRSIFLLSLIFHLSLAIVYLFMHVNGVIEPEIIVFDGALFENMTTQERINI